MNDQIKDNLTIIYSPAGVNEKLDILNEDVEILGEDIRIKGKVAIKFEFFPRPCLKYYIDTEDVTFDIEQRLSSLDKVHIKFLHRNLSHDLLITNFTPNNTIVAVPTKEPLESGDKSANEVIFHLFNFYDFMADHFIFRTSGGGLIRGNRLLLQDGHFDIIIESLPQTSEHIKNLKKSGGYAITHVGSIRRKDRKSFKIVKANDLLENLIWFFSFAKGMWAPSIFPVAFDHKKNRIWDKWGCKNISAWQDVLSWFDYHHGKVLKGLFPKFIQKMRDSEWGESIKVAIYWYIHANTQGAGTDGAIVLIQAALERLSWVFHVNVTKSISSDGFARLPAADQIRLLLLHANIPIKVPNHLKELSAFAKKYNYDGPGAFTYIRNRFVHPLVKGKNKEYDTNVLFQCWCLGLWYIELVLLYSFDYLDGYANRLTPGRWVGQIEQVPWNDKSQPRH